LALKCDTFRTFIQTHGTMLLSSVERTQRSALSFTKMTMIMPRRAASAVNHWLVVYAKYASLIV